MAATNQSPNKGRYCRKGNNQQEKKLHKSEEGTCTSREIYLQMTVPHDVSIEYAEMMYCKETVASVHAVRSIGITYTSRAFGAT